MPKNFDIKSEKVKNSNWIDDAVSAFTFFQVDSASYSDKVTVTDKNSGDSFTFNSKKDADDFIRNK